MKEECLAEESKSKNQEEDDISENLIKRVAHVKLEGGSVEGKRKDSLEGKY